jgi:arginine exporter protein ArgO
VSAALLAGLLAGYGVAVPVGAVGAYLMALAARTSLRTGVCAALGIASADGLYALIAAFGGGALARAIEPIVTPLRWVSVLVLIALAVRGGATAIRRFRDRPVTDRADLGTPATPVRAYLGLLGVTLMNPATVIYFAALVIGSQGRGGAAGDRVDQIAFALGAFGASASWQVLLAAGGALLGRTLTGGRGRLLTGLFASVLMGFLAVRVLIGAM